MIKIIAIPNGDAGFNSSLSATANPVIDALVNKKLTIRSAEITFAMNKDVFISSK